MRNKLYTNGCSFTYGHVPNDDAHDTEILRAYHAQPCNWTWAGHLGNHFSEFVNESWGGGSNLRMLRRTFDFFNKVEDSSNWIAIIQLTDPYRFEYFDNVVQHYAGVVHDAPLLDDSATDSKTIDIDDVARRAKTPIAYRNLFLNYDLIAIELFEKLFALTSYLEKKNVEYFITCMSNKCSPEVIAKDCSNLRVKEIFNLMDQNRITTLRPISHVLLDENDVESPTDRHPSKQGHKKIYRYIYNYLQAKGVMQ